MKAISRIKEVEKKTAKLLMKNFHLRNDDNDLIRVYWRAYDDYDVPPPSNPVTGAASIIRARQKLQAAGYFLPTDPEIKKQRRKQQVKMYVYALDES